jgi:multidrug resistance efflux pump
MRTIKTFNDLKDSELLYEKTLPSFGYIILLVLLALIVGVVIWSVNTPKVYVIKSSGNVQSENKNYVMSPYTGEIVGMDMSEGESVEAGDVLFTVKSVDLNLQDEQLKEQRDIYERQIGQYNKLVRSIQEDKNLFKASNPDDNLYYSQYEMYKDQIAQQKADTVAMQSYGYTDEQIAQEIGKAQSKTSEIYYSTIKSSEDQIQQAQSQLDALDAQLAAIDTGQEDYQVKADASGRLHMLAEYKEGMVAQAASPIASIGSENDVYKVVAMVAASDATRVELGDKVDIAIAGLAQSIYGTVSGEVTSIDSDVTMPQGSEGAQPYFKVDIKPSSSYLISKDGNKVNVSNGMAVETRIRYDEVSYFNYVLESLGMMVRG